MRRWVWTADDSHPMGARLTRNQRLKSSVAAMSQDDIALVLSRMPVPGRRERWARQTLGGHSQDEMDTALEHFRFISDRMEEELAASGPWLAGAMFSLADISMVSLVHRLFELFPETLPRDTYPHVTDWYERVMARPAAQFAYTAGSPETPKLAQRRTVAGIREFSVVG